MTSVTISCVTCNVARKCLAAPFFPNADHGFSIGLLLFSTRISAPNMELTSVLSCFVSTRSSYLSRIWCVSAFIGCLAPSNTRIGSIPQSTNLFVLDTIPLINPKCVNRVVRAGCSYLPVYVKLAGLLNTHAFVGLFSANALQQPALALYIHCWASTPIFLFLYSVGDFFLLNFPK